MLNPESSLQSILNPELTQTITTLARQDGQTMLEWVEKNFTGGDSDSFSTP